MSRRITFFVLAASAALIATQASADRECFENSCGLPDAAEPLAEAAPSPAIEERVAPGSGAGQKLAPASERPQMAADPALRARLPQVSEPVAEARAESAPVKLAPHRTEDVPAAVRSTRAVSAGYARAEREPVTLAPRQTNETPAEARATRVVSAGYARAERDAAPGTGYAIARSPAPRGAAIVEVPEAIHAEDGVVPAYPYVRPDPAWKLCQIDQRESARHYSCGPYSYHPYGANGYRPYGTYTAYRSPQVYMVAPNAKIISIDTAD